MKPALKLSPELKAIGEVLSADMKKKGEDQSPEIRWNGWHPFSDLASNLYSLGVQPKVIQAILRHSDIGTTLSYFVQTPADESKAALQKIEDWIQAW